MGKCTGEALKMMTGGPDAVPDENKERKMSKWLVQTTNGVDIVKADGYWSNYDDNLEFYTRTITTVYGFWSTRIEVKDTVVALFKKPYWLSVTKEKDGV